jgi:hypothetical protein
MISTILDSDSGGLSLAGRTIRVGGWVKTGREAGAGAFAFLEVNDGSCFANLQVMVDKEVAAEVGGLKGLVPTATCVLVEGELKQTPEGTKQKVRGAQRWQTGRLRGGGAAHVLIFSRAASPHQARARVAGERGAAPPFWRGGRTAMTPTSS